MTHYHLVKAEGLNRKFSSPLYLVQKTDDSGSLLDLYYLDGQVSSISNKTWEIVCALEGDEFFESLDNCPLLEPHPAPEGGYIFVGNKVRTVQEAALIIDDEGADGHYWTQDMEGMDSGIDEHYEWLCTCPEDELRSWAKQTLR